MTPSANAQPGRPGAGLAPAHRAGLPAPDRWRWLALVVVLVAGCFTIASLLCGVSVSPAMLIGARFFEGAMAGLMVPQILAIIHVTFPPQERGKVFGIWGGILGSASAAGLIAGGLLLRWNVAGLGWRPIFLINIPVGLAAIVAGWLVIRESRSPAAPRLDLVGMALAITGVLMLVYPVTEGRALGCVPGPSCSWQARQSCW